MLNLVKELSLSITGPADIPNIHLLISEIRPIWDLSSVQIKVFHSLWTMMIAEKMAHLHALPIRATVERFLTETDFVVSEEACVLKHIHRYIELLPPDESPMPENFKAVNILENYGKHKHAYPSEYPSRADLLEEARFLKRILEGAKSPVAFCHNDLLLGNMLISPNQDSVSFIDFEYCGYNHTAYDIADHFCEFAGESFYNLLPLAASFHSLL
ncbi:unnamed protein product [Schistocephalus solidus]|uniref:ethanolamine kinase n=1 Tax=Schistocephalus solidus TaxID=70667 RepID=A0A183TGZ8_SCHSO|nr:unnamed protein product [Schistocephalus solidus]